MERSKSPNWRDVALAVARLFFPQRPTLGLDARQLTPMLVTKIAISAAETRSFARATKVMREVASMPVSAKTIERVVHDVGGELAARRAAALSDDDRLVKHLRTRPGYPFTRRPNHPHSQPKKIKS